MNYTKIGKTVSCAAAAFVVGAANAYAQQAAPVEGVLEWVVGVLQGSMARSAGVIAVCVLGYLALIGHMMWVRVLQVAMGMAFIFGGAALVDAVRGSMGS